MQLVGRNRFGLLLAAGQARYQLRLVARSPIGTFTAIVLPLFVLIALHVATPTSIEYLLQGNKQIEFFAPAIATFALLNACYVNMITSVVLAREDGVLKRLHGTPLPLWAYVLGRLAAAAMVGAASAVLVLAVAAAFMGLHISPTRTAGLAGVLGLGIVVFSLLGLAVSALVPRAEAALPVGFGTMLPIAFISDVFFPATSAPAWLQHAADALPVAPIAKAAVRAVTTNSALPMTQGELLVVLAWIGGALLVTALSFRWQPGTPLLRLHRKHRD